MDMATRVQILDETGCISHSTNTLGKRYEYIYSPSSLGQATSLGEGKLWIQTC